MDARVKPAHDGGETNALSGALSVAANPQPLQHLVGGHHVAELLDDVFQRARCSSSDSAAQQSDTSRP